MIYETETKFSSLLRTLGGTIRFEELLYALQEEFKDYSQKEWNEATKRSYGVTHAAGLLPGRKVVAVGNNEDGQCNVDGWIDIVQVSCGKNHTVGLKKDGSVVAAGNNSDGRCNVGDWKDIVYIGTPYWQTVGVKKDGTMIDCGFNYDGKHRDLLIWTDVRKVFCGASSILGLKSDGSVVGTGGKIYNPHVNEHVYGPECMAENWKDAVDVACGKTHTVVLKKDGSLLFGNGAAEYGQCMLDDVKDCTRVACCGNTTVLEHKNGRIEARGFYSYDSADEWANVKQYRVEDGCTIGIKEDGTKVYCGERCWRFNGKSIC